MTVVFVSYPFDNELESSYPIYSSLKTGCVLITDQYNIKLPVYNSSTVHKYFTL